jgi:hypothetical protein
VRAEGCPASANTGEYDFSGPGDIPWSSGDGVCAAPGLSRETEVERSWTLHTGWLTDVSNRSASPDVDSLSLEFVTGGPSP